MRKWGKQIGGVCCNPGGDSPVAKTLWQKGGKKHQSTLKKL